MRFPAKLEAGKGHRISAPEGHNPSQSFENTQCRICGTSANALTFQVKGYRYLRCSSCGTLFVVPLPSNDELAEFYNSVYRVDPGTMEAGMQAKWLRLVRTVTECAEEAGRILEVGCSWGGFLVEARQAGWEVAGVDLSAEAVGYVRDHHGIRAYAGALEKSPFVAECFDAVAMWHVVEHHREPARLMAQAASCVRPGGLIALTTPNVDSLIATMAGRYWEWVAPPEHLHLLSKRGLSKLIERAGLFPLIMTTRQGDARPFAAECVISTAKRLRNLMHSLRVLGARRKVAVVGREHKHQVSCGHRIAKRVVRVTNSVTPRVGLFSGLLYGVLERGPEWLLIARRSG